MQNKLFFTVFLVMIVGCIKLVLSFIGMCSARLCCSFRESHYFGCVCVLTQTHAEVPNRHAHFVLFQKA